MHIFLLFKLQGIQQRISLMQNLLLIQELTTKENEPVTPIHERNYGMYNSKMKEEGVSWRLSCNYENSIVIEKLNMYDTASVRGQVAERKIIQLNNLDEIYTSSDLKTIYLVPGERLK